MKTHSYAYAPDLPLVTWDVVSGRITREEFKPQLHSSTALLIGFNDIKTLVRLFNEDMVYVAQSRDGKSWQFSLWDLEDFFQMLAVMPGTWFSDKIAYLLERGWASLLSREEVIRRMGWDGSI